MISSKVQLKKAQLKKVFSFSQLRKSFVLFFIVLLGFPQLGFASDHFTLTYLGSNYDGTNTTFGYELCWNGNPPELSHFTVGVCEDSLVLFSTDPDNGVLGTDGSTGIYGVKWDPPAAFDPDGCKDYSLTIVGNIGEDDNLAAVAKAGTGDVDFMPITGGS